MNIVYKLPLVLAENVILNLFPKARYFIERIYNPYYFGESYVKYTLNQYKLFKNIVEDNTGLKGKIMLELGPGGSVGLGLLAISDGLKKYYAIDSNDHLYFDKAMMMYQKLLGKNVDVQKKFKKIEIFPLNNKNGYDIADNSVDLIYSCAVLEHVKDLDGCFKEMSRVIKKGGLMSHQVDLRDHIFSQKSLFFLLIPDKVFNLFFYNTGEWVNRIRWSEYKRMFKMHGFKIVDVKFNIRLRKSFSKNLTKRYSKEDLENVSFNVVLTKI